MGVPRRHILQGTAAALAGLCAMPGPAAAQSGSPPGAPPGAQPGPLPVPAGPSAASDRTPILFVPGDGGGGALWITTVWRFESNYYPRARLFVLDMRLPSARRVDTVREPGRSSFEEATAQLAQEVSRVLRLTGAARLVLVGHGRAGNLIRNHLRLGGAATTRLAVLCGAPSHGMIVSDQHMIGSEYNGATRLLRLLNDQPGGVTPGAPVVTVASDRQDLYAQPDGQFIGLPGVPTGIGFDGPALRGATNIVLQGADHRETAYSPDAFGSIYRAITGELPQVLEIRPEVRPMLNGRVSVWDGGVPTNIPVGGALVRVFPLVPESGARRGPEVHARTTGPDGVWGPFACDNETPYEFEVTVRGYPITHIYQPPFRRGTEHLHLRPHLPTADEAKTLGQPGALALVTRPRGFFNPASSSLLIDGGTVELPPGVPIESTLRVELPAGPQRSLAASYGGERVLAVTWPREERRVTVIEISV